MPESFSELQNPTEFLKEVGKLPDIVATHSGMLRRVALALTGIETYVQHFEALRVFLDNDGVCRLEQVSLLQGIVLFGVALRDTTVTRRLLLVRHCHACNNKFKAHKNIRAVCLPEWRNNAAIARRHARLMLEVPMPTYGSSLSIRTMLTAAMLGATTCDLPELEPLLPPRKSAVKTKKHQPKSRWFGFFPLFQSLARKDIRSEKIK